MFLIEDSVIGLYIFFFFSFLFLFCLGHLGSWARHWLRHLGLWVTVRVTDQGNGCCIKREKQKKEKRQKYIKMGK